MAGRIKVNKITRWLHLHLGLILFIMLMLYISTGFIMSMYKWFEPGEETVVRRVLPLKYSPDTTKPDKLADDIKEQFAIRGRVKYSRNEKNEIQLMISRPGIKSKVVLHNSIDSVTIVQTTKSSLLEIGTRIHRLHGFKDGIGYFIWGVILDLTALAMILFSITGILLWLRMKKMFFPGFVILLCVSVFCVGMIVYLN